VLGKRKGRTAFPCCRKTEKRREEIIRIQTQPSLFAFYRVAFSSKTIERKSHGLVSLCNILERKNKRLFYKVVSVGRAVRLLLSRVKKVTR
jgi:hypothetical protein